MHGEPDVQRLPCGEGADGPDPPCPDAHRHALAARGDHGDAAGALEHGREPDACERLIVSPDRRSRPDHCDRDQPGSDREHHDRQHGEQRRAPLLSRTAPRRILRVRPCGHVPRVPNRVPVSGPLSANADCGREVPAVTERSPIGRIHWPQMSDASVHPAPAEALAAGSGGARPGVLPAQALRQAIQDEWISSPLYRIPPESVQPASLDLRLGEFAWALRCSFLPDTESKVEEKIADLAFQKIDLRDGAALERDRPYLVPLIEELRLPREIRAKANPKSSTGRLDVFTRVITDGNPAFDEIPYGYEGKLYLEIVPRRTRSTSDGARAEPAAALHRRCPPARRRGARSSTRSSRCSTLTRTRLRAWELTISDGLFLSVDLSGPTDRIVGYRAKTEQPPDRPRRASTATDGATSGSRSIPRPARGSCSNRRSSTCSSRPRARAFRPGTRPR